VIDVPSPVVVSVPVAASDSQKFSLTADRQGVTVLYATDAANNIKAELQVAVGNFWEQPDMLVDLILGTIWEPFNMFEIETSIKAPIDRWSRDVGPHL
jgi:hypothetical protein